MEATTENLAKWIDELAGDIEILRKKINNTGGDTVTITPALESGTKVADYSIGETEGSLFAPTPFIPKDYSTTEQDTGIKWVDGSPIYLRVYDMVTVAQGDNTVETSTEIDHVLLYEKSMKGQYAGDISGDTLYVNNSGNLVYYIDTPSTLMSNGMYLIVYYTKTPPVETKRGGKKK